MKALVIDDQLSILESMKFFFNLRGWQVETAATGRQGLDMAKRMEPDLVVLDIKLPDLGGLAVLEKLRADLPETQVIMITAHQDMENTISSIKLGAYDFIHKPIDIDEMDAVLSRLSKQRAQQSVGESSASQGDTHLDDGTPIIVGKSKSMKEIFKTIALLSESRVTVLIAGESGTGKELIAKAIHHQSNFRKHPFMVMDCSTLVHNLLESDLFGYEKGAFTGADSTRKGRLEMAGQGTIFLDEIGEMPLSLQSKLLRFLQEKEFYRVGGNQLLESNARIIAATNRNLAAMVQNRLFRKDLFFRLKVVTIKLPPLRERRSDIPFLCSFLLNKIGKQTQTPSKRLTPNALKTLEQFPWPGNIRQLENTLTKAAVLNKSHSLTKEDIVAALNEFDELYQENVSFKSLAEVEREHILQVLNANQGHLGKTCNTLGISRPTLRSKLKEYGKIT